MEQDKKKGSQDMEHLLHVFFSSFSKDRRGFFWDLFFSFVLLHITTMTHTEKEFLCFFSSGFDSVFGLFGASFSLCFIHGL